MHLSMDDKKQISYSRERTFSAHNLFLSAARDAIDIAESDNSKKTFSSLTAITMSALAIEALCNAVGEKIFKEWSDYESSSPKAKLRIICDKLNIAYEPKAEPWLTVTWLSQLRNKLAHGKPQLITESDSLEESHYESKSWDKPESKLEQQLTIGNAKRAYKQITELKFLLSKNMPSGSSFGIAGDMWSGRSSA
jgi:hypothetical protein